MQPHDNDQRTAQGDIDGRRDAEQPTAEDADWLECTEVPVMDDRTVCLSATITGKGWLN
jgi:hypothetical protein